MVRSPGGRGSDGWSLGSCGPSLSVLVVYRANDSDAAYLLLILKQHEVAAVLERFGKTCYVTVASDRADIPAWRGRRAGRCVRC